MGSTGWRRERRWKEVREQPFPEAWEGVLEKKVAFYRRLPGDLRERLKQHILVFLDEKRFEACGGLPAITDEMRLLVAAQACLLLIGLEKHRYYPGLRSILLYPGAFRDHGRRRFSLSEHAGDWDEEDGFFDDDPEMRLGESWTSGSVVLAWDSVRFGAAEDDDGVNVTYHEFAHQLDQTDGTADGAPVLRDVESRHRWARVMKEAFEELVEEAADNRVTFIDDYGATNPAEFFAVVTETFFEQARELRRGHSELYEALKDYYGLDPAQWEASAGA